MIGKGHFDDLAHVRFTQKFGWGAHSFSVLALLMTRFELSFMQRKKSPHGKDFSNETSSEAYETTVNFEVFHCIPLLFEPHL
jgi:hypothetical protein